MQTKGAPVMGLFSLVAKTMSFAFWKLWPIFGPSINNNKF
jgi:hypothetical protein